MGNAQNTEKVPRKPLDFLPMKLHVRAKRPHAVLVSHGKNDGPHSCLWVPHFFVDPAMVHKLKDGRLLTFGVDRGFLTRRGWLPVGRKAQ